MGSRVRRGQPNVAGWVWRLGVAATTLSSLLIVVEPAGTSAAARTSSASAGRPPIPARSPIFVGGVWDQATYGGADIGAQAAFRAFNARGGLGGRRIRFVGMLDDGNSVARDIAATKTLVSEGVFAVAPVLTGSWDGGTVLQHERIPYFGMDASQSWSGSRDGFSFTGANSFRPPSPSVRPLSTVICRVISRGCSGKAVALISATDPSSEATLHQLEAEYRASGARIVYTNTSVPPPPADYLPFTRAVLSADGGRQPALVQEVLPPGSDLAIASLLRQTGFKGTDLGFSPYEPRALAGSGGADTIMDFVPFEQHSPLVDTIARQVRAFNPHVVLDQSVLAGYLSALELIEALKKSGPGVSPGRLVATLNQGWTFTEPGAVCPVDFPAAHFSPANGTAIVRSTGVAYRVVVPLQCPAPIPDPLLSNHA